MGQSFKCLVWGTARTSCITTSTCFDAKEILFCDQFPRVNRSTITILELAMAAASDIHANLWDSIWRTPDASAPNELRECHAHTQTIEDGSTAVDTRIVSNGFLHSLVVDTAGMAGELILTIDGETKYTWEISGSTADDPVELRLNKDVAWKDIQRKNVYDACPMNLGRIDRLHAKFIPTEAASGAKTITVTGRSILQIKPP